MESEQSRSLENILRNQGLLYENENSNKHSTDKYLDVISSDNNIININCKNADRSMSYKYSVIRRVLSQPIVWNNNTEFVKPCSWRLLQIINCFFEFEDLIRLPLNLITGGWSIYTSWRFSCKNAILISIWYKGYCFTIATDKKCEQNVDGLPKRVSLSINTISLSVAFGNQPCLQVLNMSIGEIW